MKTEILDSVEKKNLKSEIPHFEVGDTVDVHCKIEEGNKTRIQIFSGIVIARKGTRNQRNLYRPKNRKRRRGRKNLPVTFAKCRRY